jgi:tetratricopeptide (TPR) repeat protein
VSERDPRLAEADAMIQTRHFADAFALLDAFLVERPMDIDARLLALRASESAGDTVRRAAAFAGLVATYGRSGQVEPMVALHAEAIAAGLGDAIAAADHARVARIQEDQGHLDLAEDAYRRAHVGVASDTASVRAMFAHARLAALRGDRRSAIELYSALARADGPALELRADVTKVLQTLADEEATPEGDMTMPELIEVRDPTYDVFVTATPETTPSGEGFVPALAAAFGVPEDVAARLAAGAPMKVKRGVTLSEAERMCVLLASLGASVELLSNDVALPETVPPPRTPPSPPLTSLPPVAAQPSFAPTASQAPAPIGIVVRPSMSPPRSSGAPMPQPAVPSPALQLPLFTIPTNVIRAAAVAGVLAVLLLSVRWLKQQTSAHQLGNAGKGESRCINKDCLAMLGLDRKTDTQAQFTLVVAWRHGCLDETGYGTYLDGLHEKHGKSGLQVVGAGLGVPATNDPRSLSQGFQPAPADFPPAGCERGFRVVPTRSGFVEDFFSPPATYLYDDGGYLMAVWKGGMSPSQRDALAAYLDQKL